MCSNNTLNYILKIYSLLMDINVEKLRLLNHNNAKLLRYVSFAKEEDGKEENDGIEEKLISDITDKMNEVFHSTIGLILSTEGNDNTAFDEALYSIVQLTKSIKEINGIKRIKIDYNLQDLVDRAIGKLIQRSNKHYELISNIINCKNLLYKS